MYQIEVLFEDNSRIIDAMQVLSVYLDCSLREAKHKMLHVLNKEYTWIDLNLSKSAFEKAYWDFFNVGFRIRNIKNLQAQLDVDYVETHFGDMWQEELDNYYLEQNGLEGASKYRIYLKKPPRFCVIENPRAKEYVIQKMLEAGVEVRNEASE